MKTIKLQMELPLPAMIWFAVFLSDVQKVAPLTKHEIEILNTLHYALVDIIMDEPGIEEEIERIKLLANNTKN